MLATPLCQLLGIRVPVIQGPLGGPWNQTMELAAAVCEAGGLGSIPTSLRGADRVLRDMARLRELTDRPFAVNHTRRPFSEEAFAATLREPPAVVSVALGDPGDLVKRVHEAGALYMHQVTTVEQARRAADAGADVISAQGMESGGFSGGVSALALVPQVVDAVRPIPVVASGGIADGRGLAAALVLGAQGVNIGTRFLAAAECGIPEAWKQRIVEARSEDAVKVEFADLVMPAPTAGGYPTLPRSLRTPFVDRWNSDPAAAEREAERLRGEVDAAMAGGRAHELVPLTGQSAGIITEILPAAEIVRRMVAEAEAALRSAEPFLG
jgi:nitronate monooxygenase/enoyl-[acyl-carrier protein] reductase II